MELAIQRKYIEAYPRIENLMVAFSGKNVQQKVVQMEAVVLQDLVSAVSFRVFSLIIMG